RLAVSVPFPADPSATIPTELLAALEDLVIPAAEKLVERAFEAPDTEDARHTLCWALKNRLDDALPEAAARRLRLTPIFPCTDGVSRSAAELDRFKTVAYVTAALEGTLRRGAPVVVVREPDLAVA